MVSDRGFTLIELLGVLAVLGILAWASRGMGWNPTQRTLAQTDLQRLGTLISTGAELSLATASTLTLQADPASQQVGLFDAQGRLLDQPPPFSLHFTVEGLPLQFQRGFTPPTTLKIHSQQLGTTLLEVGTAGSSRVIRP